MKAMTKRLPNPDFARALLDWYAHAAAPMPWRGLRDPYRVWLSEVMLQQTRVTTVEGYYTRFLEAFPTIGSLAAAPLDQVLKQWEGLGYYARARNLHRLARVIMEEHGGRFPASADALRHLPGIGRYTAAAIASIAFDQPVAVLDGNVIRVLARLINLPDDVTQARVKASLWQLAESLLPTERPGDYNQALMDLGRTICTPRRPACGICPVREFCLARAGGNVESRPVKKPKAPLPQVRAVAAVVRAPGAANRLLLVQRPAEGLLGGLWALPGGLCEGDEPLHDRLRRALRRDLGVEIAVGDEMAVATQTFTHFRMTLRAYACNLTAGEPRPLGVANLAWVAPADLVQYSMGKADRAIVEALDCWQPRLFEEI
jgi:A/G-specific adenine glycosylase